MNFLPEDYEAPRSGGAWMKIQQGENKIRILSQPILGWEDWTLDKKPMRYRFDQKPERAINPKQPVKHFWSFIVWNYSEEKIQILHITQAGIRKGIETLCKDEDWGAPFFYDIKIIKEGEEMKTKYGVNPLPHKPVSSAIMKEFNENPCYLEAIFENDDPFSKEFKNHTKGIFSQEQLQVKDEDKAEISKEIISNEQAKELNGILENCDPEYVKTVMQSLKKSDPSINRIDQLPVAIYPRLKTAALKKMAEYQVSLKGDVDWILEAAQ